MNSKSAAKSVIGHYSKRLAKICALRPSLIKIAAQKACPCYVYDPSEVKENVTRFIKAFSKAGISIEPHYALKSNPYHGILKTVVDCGGGLDVSSQRELNFALATKTKKIVYTGPGKSLEDFESILRIKNREIIVHLESFNELDCLGKLLRKRKRNLICGVRVVPSSHEGWSKFGIPLKELPRFMKASEKYPEIILSGIQFHISYLKDHKPFKKALHEIFEVVKCDLNDSQRERVKFIDIGGGFYPEVFEGEYPWNKKGVLFYDEKDLLGKIRKDAFRKRALKIEVEPIEKMASGIAAAFAPLRRLFPRLRILAEPGRYISYSAMHFVMKVADIKDEHSCIVNAGWNSIGWERYQYLHYVPLYNLTRFNPIREVPMVVYGNLCLPDDIWGYYLHGDKLALGDLILLPFQGAYTYTYVQNFIRGIPPVVDLKEK